MRFSAEQRMALGTADSSNMIMSSAQRNSWAVLAATMHEALHYEGRQILHRMSKVDANEMKLAY